MKTEERLLSRYVEAAADLAEALKRNIVHNKVTVKGVELTVVDDKTVLALNNFVIAANSIKDMTEVLTKRNNTFNQ